MGSNIQKEQPLLSTRIRRAITNGAKVTVVNSVDYQFNFVVDSKIITAPQHLPEAIADVKKNLEGKNKAIILLGALALHHPQASLIREQANKVAQATGAKIGYLTCGANSAGGWIAGAIPHRHAGGEAINHAGLNAYAMFEKPRKAYILLNVEPDLDCANTQHAIAALAQSSFVVALSMYRDPVLEEHADVILPIGAFTESSGTYVNVNGEWQSFSGVAEPFGSSRPAWKVLRVLGNFLRLEGFEYESSEAVKNELKALVAKTMVAAKSFTPKYQHRSLDGVFRIGEIPIYSTDSLVRRSEELQATQEIMDGPSSNVRLHPETAEKLKLADGDAVKVRQQQSGTVKLTVALDKRIAKDAAWIASGIPATRHLGELFACVEIEKK